MIVYRTLHNVPDDWYRGLTEIYRQAFTQPPYYKGWEEVIYFENSLPAHEQREGFRMVGVLVDDRLCGFAYGYTSFPDYYWETEVSRWLELETAEKWLADAFHLAEIALLPEFWGRGLGGGLHDHLLQGRPQRTAVLSTIAAPSNAFHLYARRGWQVLLDRFSPPGMMRVYRMLGLKLASRVLGEETDF